MPDPDAEWVRAHQAALWRFVRMLGARPDEAEDVLQEVLLAGLGHPRRAGWSEAEAGRWLRTVARNRYCQLLRDRRRRRDVPDSDLVELCEQSIAETPELLGRLRRCIEQLAPRSRRAVELRYRDGLAREEMAGPLGLRVEGVKSLLQRIRATLRECVERNEP